MAQSRKPAAGKNAKVVRASTGSKKPFYIILALAAIVAIGALSYMTSQTGKSKIITLDGTLPPVTSQGYVIGSPSAPLELIEFGDFECPVCSDFAVMTEPDIRSQYVNTGKVRFRFIDFPLNMHKNTVNASNAAACADEQGKFWEMHDQIFATQHEWNGAATNNPDKYFKSLAAQIQGIDQAKFGECVDTRRMLPKVQSHQKIANDRAIASTPTFVLGNKQFNNMSSDEFRKVLDAELAAASPVKPEAKKP